MRSRARCAWSTPARSGVLHDHRSANHRDCHFHALHVSWRRADRPRPADAPHPVDVRRERRQRHHDRWRPDHRGQRPRVDLDLFRLHRHCARHDERGGWLRGDRPDAGHVQVRAKGETLMPGWLNQILYLVSAVLFIIGLKRLGSPATARQGNMISEIGMLIAILVTLVDHTVVSYGVIAAGMVVGTALGLWQAYAVKMTAMPQMVALLNGFGGGASMVVGAAEFYRVFESGANIPTPTGVVMQLSLIIGAVTLTGSLVAFAKLQ